MKYKGFHAMEIYNHGCVVEGYDDYVPQIFDAMLRKGNRIFCVATDDNHNRHAEGSPFFDSLGGDASSPVRVWRNQIENGSNQLFSKGKTFRSRWIAALKDISENLKEID